MPFEIDYLPVATGAGANVDTQADFVGSGYQTVGFQAGLAKSDQINKVLRQSSMMSAAWANLISQRLGISVLDDGNLPNLVAELGQTIGAISISNPGIDAAASSSAAQNLFLYSFSSGFWNVLNRTVRFTAGGTFGFNGGSGQLQFGMTLGGVSIGSLLSVPPSSGSNNPYYLVIQLTTVALGATGLIQVNGTFTPSGNAVNQSQAIYSNFINVNTTTAAGVQLQCTFNSGSTNNFVIQNLEMIEILN